MTHYRTYCVFLPLAFAFARLARALKIIALAKGAPFSLVPNFNLPATLVITVKFGV
jgi:hypothetical protein